MGAVLGPAWLSRLATSDGSTVDGHGRPVTPGVRGRGPVLPLIIYLVTDRSDPFTKAHAAEALNFQLTVLIASVVATVAIIPLAVLTAGLALILFIPAVIAAAVVEIVWCVKGAIAAGRSESWLYPWCLRMVH